MVERARNDGTAKLLAGGGAPGGDLAAGFYVEPTVFGDVDPASELGQVEVFGPVLSLMRFDDRGRGAADRQRHLLRPGLLRLDQRHGPDQPPGAAAGGRRRLRQRRHRRSPAASCPSAASASRASVARAASKGCSSSCGPRRWRSHDGAAGTGRCGRGAHRRRQRHRARHGPVARRPRVPDRGERHRRRSGRGDGGARASGRRRGGEPRGRRLGAGGPRGAPRPVPAPVRPARPRDEQRRRAGDGAARVAAARGVAAGPRPQPHERRPEQPRVPAPPDRAGARPRGEHRVGVGPARLRVRPAPVRRQQARRGGASPRRSRSTSPPRGSA